MKTKQQSINLNLDELSNYALASKRKCVFKLSNKHLYMSMPIFNSYNALLKDHKLLMDTNTPIVLIYHDNKFIIIPFMSINDVPFQLKQYAKYWHKSVSKNNNSAMKIACSNFFEDKNDEYELEGEIGIVSNYTAIICSLNKIR